MPRTVRKYPAKVRNCPQSKTALLCHLDGQIHLRPCRSVKALIFPPATHTEFKTRYVEPIESSLGVEISMFKPDLKPSKTQHLWNQDLRRYLTRSKIFGLWTSLDWKIQIPFLKTSRFWTTSGWPLALENQQLMATKLQRVEMTGFPMLSPESADVIESPGRLQKP